MVGHRYDRSPLPPLSRHGADGTIRSSMEPSKECPLCGERMRQKKREEVTIIPGTSEVKTRKVAEWICPDCDYFEEVEEDAGPS
jgi:YgiT-type zinc finger domain-containing protein